MRNPIIRNTALFLMTSAMEDHQRKLAKEIETKRLEEEKAKNEQIYGWQLGGPSAGCIQTYHTSKPIPSLPMPLL